MTKTNGLLAKECSQPDCQSPVLAKGLCSTHYARVRRTGSVVLSTKPWEPRFWAKVDTSGDCWLWLSYKTHEGYGRFRLNGSMRSAHRVAYQRYVGPIEAGKQLDHKCHTPSCVNYSHLRVVSQKQNNENGSGAYKNNTSGVRGVGFHKASNKWRARVRHNGELHELGTFDTVEEANHAAITKRNELFTHNDLDRKVQENDQARRHSR